MKWQTTTLRYGIAIGTHGQVQPWRETSPGQVTTLPRVPQSGLHLIAYGVAPRSLGLYAIALDVLSDVRPSRRPSQSEIEAAVAEVVPALIEAGESGIDAATIRTWLALREVVTEGGGG